MACKTPTASKGGWRFPDVSFDEVKVILEIDGRGLHSSADAFEADHRRQAHLVEAGWTVFGSRRDK